MPEQAENCGRQRSLTDTTNGLRSGQGQVDPLCETSSKQRVMQLDWGRARATCGRDERVMVGTHGQSSDALPG